MHRCAARRGSSLRYHGPPPLPLAHLLSRADLIYINETFTWLASRGPIDNETAVGKQEGAEIRSAAAIAVVPRQPHPDGIPRIVDSSIKRWPSSTPNLSSGKVLLDERRTPLQPATARFRCMSCTHRERSRPLTEGSTARTINRWIWLSIQVPHRKHVTVPTPARYARAKPFRPRVVGGIANKATRRCEWVGPIGGYVGK